MSGRCSVFPTWFPVSGWKVKSPGMTLGSTMSGGRRSHERFTYRSGFISGNFKAAVRCKVTVRFPSYFLPSFLFSSLPLLHLLLVPLYLPHSLRDIKRVFVYHGPVRPFVCQPSKNRQHRNLAHTRSETIHPSSQPLPSLSLGRSARPSFLPPVEIRGSPERVRIC